MVDIHNDNIPALGNTIAADIPDIKENLEFHKDAFQQITSGWSNSSVANLYLNFPGLWYGGNPSNATDTDHDITIATGQFTLYNGSTYQGFNLSSAITKKIDANWSAGTNQGGFPSGLTLGASTMYYVFIIGKSDGTVDVGFDTDSSATNLLTDATGYTFYRIVRDNFAVFTDSSSNIRNFNVIGDKVFYEAQILDVDDSTLTDDTYETDTFTVPPSTVGIFHGRSSSTDNGDMAIYTMTVKNPTTGAEAIVNEMFAYTSGNIAGGSMFIFDVNASSQMQYKQTVGTGDTTNTLKIYTTGYFLTT